MSFWNSAIRETKAAEHFANDLPFVGGEEHEIAFRDLQLRGQRGLLFFAKKLHERRLPFAVLHLDEREPLGAVQLRHRRQLFHLAGGDERKALRVDRLDRAAGVERAAEHLEAARRKHVGEVDQRHRETPIGLVAAELIHRLVPGHARERRRNLDAARGAEDRREHPFDEPENILRLNERSFDVDLGEFRLPIGAQIFVAKAFRDLEILLDPAHHQQLLVLLRRLRQARRTSRA